MRSITEKNIFFILAYNIKLYYLMYSFPKLTLVFFGLGNVCQVIEDVMSLFKGYAAAVAGVLIL